jgi:hemolysin activation/secretion protein
MFSQCPLVSFSSTHIRAAAVFLCCWGQVVTPGLPGAELHLRDSRGGVPAAGASVSAVADTAETRLNVRSYVVEGKTLLATNRLPALFAKYTGTHIDMRQLARAAADLEGEYRNQGFADMSVAVGSPSAAPGVVTMNVFKAAFPQILIFGRRYVLSSNEVTAAANPSAEEIAAAQERPAPTATTQAGPRFDVEKYLVMGNSLLAPEAIAQALTNASGAFGTNVVFGGIRAAQAQLRKAYLARGYVTVAVDVPQQKLTNATVKLQVTEGRLAAIRVAGNRYFSSNNVMRALPSLHPDMVLNGHIFQAELNRANANQDRQIYPVISPGAEPATSDLTLKVKDRLPLHAKLELNNQSSPGTPDLRLNTSAVYNNLWQREHSLGVQYNFSPELYKPGDQWNLYDQPRIATYSAFYRMPLAGPESLEDVVEAQPGTFGYNEATRKFNLPPPSGLPELSLYASRATIDTGIENVDNSTITGASTNLMITRHDYQQDITVNETMGFRLSKPSQQGDFRFVVSGGLDYKSYLLQAFQTNVFNFTEIYFNPDGSLAPPVVSEVINPAPVTTRKLQYVPLSLGWNVSWHTPRLTISPGVGISANLWHSGTRTNLQEIVGSAHPTGDWLALMPSLSAQFVFHTNWVLSLRANGQWVNKPLINNEQFGAGGVGSVRGYHEGEVFGDNGWFVSLEQATPAHLVGFISGRLPLTVRGSIYTDFAETYLLDRPALRPSVALWGVGVGGVVSIGPYWDARLLFSMPLLSAGTTRAYQPFFNFALTSQF